MWAFIMGVFCVPGKKAKKATACSSSPSAPFRRLPTDALPPLIRSSRYGLKCIPDKEGFEIAFASFD